MDKKDGSCGSTESPNPAREASLALTVHTIGRTSLIPQPARAALITEAARRLRARCTPEPLVTSLLGALEYLGALPTGRQLYRENLANYTTASWYLRARYQTKRRAVGILFLDLHLDLLAVAEGVFDEGAGAEEKLIAKARELGAKRMIGYRYYRQRKNPPSAEAVQFYRSMQQATKGRLVRFLDYLIVTPTQALTCLQT
jgi:hypothetical protein